MYLGFDTSNYTTSIALYDGEKAYSFKQLLNVKDGERGLRQSDAVFQHTVNIPKLINNIEIDNININAIGVSNRPRNIDGSYMPCFLVGESNAVSVSKFTGASLYKTSHQIGHILAALYSVNRLDLINNKFIAFHVSGGTTEALLVTPDDNQIIRADLIAQSTDLKAGQAIDRAGVLMGIKFPCGKEVDRLSLLSDKDYKVRPSMNGLNCSLSGVENKVKNMLENGESNEDTAKFLLTYLGATIESMTERIINEFGQLPLVFAGGVMSNTMIKKRIQSKFNAYFAQPEFSCDNAVGTAVFAYLKDNLK